MSLLSKLKYYLGMKCIAKYGNSYVVTARAGRTRACLDRETHSWWPIEHCGKFCTLPSIESAQARLEFALHPDSYPKVRPI